MNFLNQKWLYSLEEIASHQNTSEDTDKLNEALDYDQPLEAIPVIKNDDQSLEAIPVIENDNQSLEDIPVIENDDQSLEAIPVIEGDSLSDEEVADIENLDKILLDINHKTINNLYDNVGQIDMADIDEIVEAEEVIEDLSELMDGVKVADIEGSVDGKELTNEQIAYKLKRMYPTEFPKTLGGQWLNIALANVAAELNTTPEVLHTLVNDIKEGELETMQNKNLSREGSISDIASDYEWAIRSNAADETYKEIDERIKTRLLDQLKRLEYNY